MPTDAKGKFHLGAQRAHAADRAMPSHESAPPSHEMGQASQAHTTLHDHGDGTFHTEGHDGEVQEHPHIDHALAHLAAKHGGGSSMHGEPKGSDGCGGMGY